VPPDPDPIRLIRSSSEKFTWSSVDELDEDGAELGGRGRGTARDVSRWGRGRVRSGRRRRCWLRLAAAAAAGSGGGGWIPLIVLVAGLGGGIWSSIFY
jgi:hypothetical protein